MFRFFAQTRAIFGQKFEYADFGAKLGIFSVKFHEEWNLDEMFAHARWFFSHGFSHVSRVFARFSHDLFFQGFFFSHGFSHVSRVFARFSHDLFFKVFRLHVSRVFARSSHAGRRPACLCQIRSKSAQIWRKSLVSIARTPKF